MAQTPWGQSQGQTTWAPGITCFHTASHGGVHLDKERQAQLPDWAKITNWLGTHQWWEEDEDWCVPFLAFLDDIRTYATEHPDEWFAKNIDENLGHALSTSRMCHPTVYAGYMANQSSRSKGDHMATLKKETIQITLEKGSGTILVSRPDNTAKSIGLIHQFTYTSDAAMDLIQALTAARRQLTAQMAAAAAKPAPPAAKPATTGAEPTDEDDQADANDEATEGDEPEAEQADDDPTDDLTAELGKAALTNPNSDPASAPPELEPITDDQADDDLTNAGDIQALLLL